MGTLLLVYLAPIMTMGAFLFADYTQGGIPMDMKKSINDYLRGVEEAKRRRSLAFDKSEHDTTTQRQEKKDYQAQGQPILVRAENNEELHKLINVLVNKYDFSGRRAITEGGIEGDMGGCCPWIFVNVEGRSYRIGKAGICFAKPVLNRWIKPKDFLTILDIVYRSEKIDKELL